MKHWQNIARGGLRSLIRKNCDIAYDCAVPEDVYRTASRRSASGPPRISYLPTEPEPTESSFQACSSYTANLFCSDRPGFIEQSESWKVTKSCGIGSARTPTMTNFFHNRDAGPNRSD
jgi:hypothetical protein